MLSRQKFKQKALWLKLITNLFLTIILVQIAIFAIALLIGFSILMFLSFALVNTLSKATDSPALSYLIVAGIWALICLLIFTFKTVLIVNPITRFVTKLMFNNPQDENK